MDIGSVIEQKKALLALVRAKADELEEQIRSLSAMKAQHELDQLLLVKLQDHQGQLGDLNAAIANSIKERRQISPDILEERRLSASPKGRNPKGSVRTVLLDGILADGEEHGLDEIEELLKARLPNILKRGAIRNVLMNLTVSGEIRRCKPGIYRLAKGEGPGGTGPSGATNVGQT